MALRITLPAIIECFIRARYPTRECIEICQSYSRVVVHRGWMPVAEGCRPKNADEINVVNFLMDLV